MKFNNPVYISIIIGKLLMVYKKKSVWKDRLKKNNIKSIVPVKKRQVFPDDGEDFRDCVKSSSLSAKLNI